MPTLTEQITDMIAGYTNLKAYYEGIRDSIDDRVDAVILNLSAFIQDRFSFEATFDPDEANPTNERGGTYASLDTLLRDAPRGSTVFVNLPPNRTVSVTDQRAFVHHKYVIFQGDPDNRSTLNFPTYLNNAGNNARNRLFFIYDAEVQFRDIDIMLEGKADPGELWQSSERTACNSQNGGKVKIRLENVNVTGSDDAAMVTCGVGNHIQVILQSVDVDGACSIVDEADEGIASIATANVTLSGGAALQIGGTVVTGTVFTN